MCSAPSIPPSGPRWTSTSRPARSAARNWRTWPGLPAMLRKVPIVEAERLAAYEQDPELAGVPSAEMLTSLIARTANVRRIHRWRTVAAAAAVAIVALGGGAFAANALQPSGAPAPPGSRRPGPWPGSRPAAMARWPAHTSRCATGTSRGARGWKSTSPACSRAACVSSRSPTPPAGSRWSVAGRCGREPPGTAPRPGSARRNCAASR